jgi:hypothetical protein
MGAEFNNSKIVFKSAQHAQWEKIQKMSITLEMFISQSLKLDKNANVKCSKLNDLAFLESWQRT